MVIMNKQYLVNNFGLLGVGLTVVSLRGELATNSFGFWVMLICGFFIIGLSLAGFLFDKNK